GGERSYSLYKYRNNNGIATASFDYKIDDHQTIALSNTFNTFNRKGEDEANPDNDRYDKPRKTMKNVLGLGYTYEQENWNASVFMKNFFQQNEFTASYNPTGNYGDVAYYNTINTFNHIGYGTALTYFLHKNLQFKASFEKTYRLPAANELFGDVINLQGNTDLKPEYSYNYNLGTSYWLTFKQDLINFNLNTFYRDASDFIRPELNQNQTMQVMGNLASVTNAGIESEIRYQHGKSFAAGLSVTYQELRNDTRFVGDQTVESIVYRDRIPNMPYLYGNADANYTFFNVLRKDDNFNIGYNLLYVHEFYLYWPSQGSEKLVIPEQLAHDVTLTYTLNKKLQFTLECRNITDRNLYDNFSLQKPGRAFFGKIKYTIL
ncbi:MAG: TonB-dependent receptor, partial [Bacteroidota bacterium]|nr:TonB-dependent receptor [Bacteroidota bacterium]